MHATKVKPRSRTISMFMKDLFLDFFLNKLFVKNSHAKLFIEKSANFRFFTKTFLKIGRVSRGAIQTQSKISDRAFYENN